MLHTWAEPGAKNSFTVKVCRAERMVGVGGGQATQINQVKSPLCATISWPWEAVRPVPGERLLGGTQSSEVLGLRSRGLGQFLGAKRERGQEVTFESQGQVHLEGGEGPRQPEREAQLVWEGAALAAGQRAHRGQMGKGGLECRVKEFGFQTLQNGNFSRIWRQRMIGSHLF